MEKYYQKYLEIPLHMLLIDKGQYIKDDLKKYSHEIELQKSNMKKGECPICFETKNIIPFECPSNLHYYCFKCYNKLNVCTFCRHKKNK